MENIIAIEDRVQSLEVLLECQTLDRAQPDAAMNDVSSGDKRCPPHTGSSPVYIATKLHLDRSMSETSMAEGGKEILPPTTSVQHENINSDNRKDPNSRLTASGDPDQSLGAPIPVLVSSRHANSHEQTYRMASDSERFTVPTRRHAKRFCVLGLSRNVKTDILANVIQSKGPSISNICVFPCKRDPSKVVLRLNLMANEESGRVLENGFWPDYVTCKPWVTRSRMRQKTRTRDVPPRFQTTRQAEHVYRQNDGTDWSRYQFVSNNRFDTLSCDVD